MKNKRDIQALKGFTIVELLVVLVLSAICVTFSYSTLSYVQKLFHAYKAQSRFITEFTDLKNRMDYESRSAACIKELAPNHFEVLHVGSEPGSMDLLEKAIVLKHQSRCDTFHFEAKQIQKEYEPMNRTEWKNVLLKRLEFDVVFSQQNFHFYFFKEYPASRKLAWDSENELNDGRY